MVLRQAQDERLRGRVLIEIEKNFFCIVESGLSMTAIPESCSDSVRPELVEGPSSCIQLRTVLALTEGIFGQDLSEIQKLCLVLRRAQDERGLGRVLSEIE